MSKSLEWTDAGGSAPTDSAHANEAHVAAARAARLATPMTTVTIAAYVRQPDDGWILAEPFPMSKSSVRAITALILALTPPLPAPQVDVAEVVLTLRRFMRYFPGPIAKGFLWLVRLLDWSPIWRFRSLRRLRSLPRDRACAVLNGLAKSRIALLRQLVVAARGAVLSMYFDDDKVHQALGYDPLPFARERMALRQRLVAGGAVSPEDQIGPHSKEVAP